MGLKVWFSTDRLFGGFDWSALAAGDAEQLVWVLRRCVGATVVVLLFGVGSFILPWVSVNSQIVGLDAPNTAAQQVTVSGSVSGFGLNAVPLVSSGLVAAQTSFAEGSHVWAVESPVPETSGFPVLVTVVGLVVGVAVGFSTQQWFYVLPALASGVLLLCLPDLPAPGVLLVFSATAVVYGAVTQIALLGFLGGFLAWKASTAGSVLVVSNLNFLGRPAWGAQMFGLASTAMFIVALLVAGTLWWSHRLAARDSDNPGFWGVVRRAAVVTLANAQTEVSRKKL